MRVQGIWRGLRICSGEKIHLVDHQHMSEDVCLLSVARTLQAEPLWQEQFEREVVIVVAGLVPALSHELSRSQLIRVESLDY